MPWGGTIDADGVGERADARVDQAARAGLGAEPAHAGLAVRVRGRAERSRRRFAVNGKTRAAAPDRFGYVTLDRVWKNGDTIDDRVPDRGRGKSLPTRACKDDRGRMAIERGPIVYCAEWPDCEGGQRARPARRPTRRAGAGGGSVARRWCHGARHRARRLTKPARPTRSRCGSIPYHLWANRGAGEMSVWLADARATCPATSARPAD